MSSRTGGLVSLPLWGHDAGGEGAPARPAGRLGRWLDLVRSGAAVDGGAGTWRPLARDATLRLDPGSSGAVVVASRAGTLLVTQEGDPADHVLEAGSAVRLERRGLVVVWALTDAEVVLRASSPP